MATDALSVALTALEDFFGLTGLGHEGCTELFVLWWLDGDGRLCGGGVAEGRTIVAVGNRHRERHAPA